MLTFGSVCSGIEAASVAWKPLGWRCAFMSEIEKFPRAVLAHHYPDVPLHGDFTTIKAGDYEPIDVLVGGTPCQSFSIAGLRGGMADARGNLALEYLRLADRLRPRWVVWENVPGVLSSNGGRDFGSFLGGLGELGYGFAYRVLDAQFFGLAQRRKRVFVVGYLGDWRRAAAVLFEPQSLSGDRPPRREARKDVAPTIAACTSGGGGLGTDFDCDGGLISTDLSHPLLAKGNSSHRADLETYVAAFGGNNTQGAIDIATAVRAKGGTGHGDFESETFIAHALRGEGFDASEDGTGRGTPLVAVARGVTIHGTDPTVQKVASYDDVAQCLRARTPGNIDNSSTTVVEQPITYAIQERAVSENPNAGPDGMGVGVGVAYTLEARQQVQAVAYQVTGNDGARATGDITGALDTGTDRTSTVVAFSCKDHGADAGDIAPTMRAMGHAGSHANAGGQIAVATYGFQPRIARNGRGDMGDVVSALNAQSGETGKGDAAPCVAVSVFQSSQSGVREVETHATLDANNGSRRHNGVTIGSAVRRLTPMECERLQGFPDGYTDVPWRKKNWTPDGPRYKALGNSFAVPVVAWIGRRIAAEDAR